MGVWQVSPGPCLTLLCPVGGHPQNGHFRGGPPTGRVMAISNPFGHPTPYAYEPILDYSTKVCNNSLNSDVYDRMEVTPTLGEFHDQGDAKWIVIRAPLSGHNDTPFGRPSPGRLISNPGVGRPSGVFGDFSYYLLHDKRRGFYGLILTLPHPLPFFIFMFDAKNGCSN
jgi:hypothetical protein